MSEFIFKPKPKHPKKCVVCGKDYFGYFQQKRCFKCITEIKQRQYNKTHCLKCGRYSRSLIGEICSYCRKIDRENKKVKINDN